MLIFKKTIIVKNANRVIEIIFVLTDFFPKSINQYEITTTRVYGSRIKITNQVKRAVNI